MRLLLQFYFTTTAAAIKLLILSLIDLILICLPIWKEDN